MMGTYFPAIVMSVAVRPFVAELALAAAALEPGAAPVPDVWTVTEDPTVTSPLVDEV
jgi:hypothetical protein